MFSSKRTVDEVPTLLLPIFWLYAILGGSWFYFQNIIYSTFCRIEYVGKEHVENSTHRILSLWHDNGPLFFMAHRNFREPNCWLTFPLWYMKPAHVLKKMIGVKDLAYGASGHEGKKALEKVLGRLQEGWSTFINPDGPAGPEKKVKNGVLVMSLKTGTPIIPISFQTTKEWHLPSWDRKRYPYFFSKVVVIYGKPIYVTKENFEEMRMLLSKEMSTPEGMLKGERKAPNL